MKANSWFTYSAGAFALVFVISASNCHTDTVIVPYVNEICNDNIDNDGDGLTDCKDSDCALECRAQVTLNPIAADATSDTLQISGTQSHAASISITVTSPGIASQPSVSGPAWQSSLTGLTEKTLYNVVVIATDSNNQSDTAKGSFTRK